MTLHKHVAWKSATSSLRPPSMTTLRALLASNTCFQVLDCPSSGQFLPKAPRLYRFLRQWNFQPKSSQQSAGPNEVLLGRVSTSPLSNKYWNDATILSPPFQLVSEHALATFPLDLDFQDATRTLPMCEAGALNLAFRLFGRALSPLLRLHP